MKNVADLAVLADSSAQLCKLKLTEINWTKLRWIELKFELFIKNRKNELKWLKLPEINGN